MRIEAKEEMETGIKKRKFSPQNADMTLEEAGISMQLTVDQLFENGVIDYLTAGRVAQRIGQLTSPKS